MFLKVNIKLQKEAKSGPSKSEGKGTYFSATVYAQ